ncbi:BTAD domain-containing putative transcriptional regulator [Nocardioides sp.]|uniref:BTAD domain-containing putative transcriptional regulator n=1 Tax=Nocardioides sp. TaxID=35761 RepID=UPI00271EE9F2|nr:BTAD domain-containing putative transcriptional regulator [Nocardioides sp.]MDO9456188.1 BTAD domain-containing putative transcriptional regulator [Nocardioides sp.]
MTSSGLERAVADGDVDAVLRAVSGPSDESLRPGEVALLDRAATLVAPDGGPLPVALAWRLGYALHQSGSFAAALVVYARADHDEPDPDPVDGAFLLSSKASSLWATGDAEASRAATDAALAAAQACGDDAAVAAAWVSQALVCVLEGDLDANLVAYEKGLAAAERAGDVLTQARVHNNLGSRCNSEGRYTEALPHLDRAIALAESVSAPPPVRALSLITRSDSLLGLGRVEECLAELHLARALTRTSESPLLGLAVVGIGDANRLCGNATQAAIAYREALVIAERTGNAQIAVPATSGLARALVVDDVDEALGLVKRALDQPAAVGQVDPLLAAGWVCLAIGNRDDAGEFSRLAVREAGRRHDARGLAEALELQSLLITGPRALDLLDEAGTLWRSTANAVGIATNQALRARATGDTVQEQAARRRLRALGVRDDATRIAGPLQALGTADRARVSIRTLGAFAVLCDGEPVPASAWQSRKSRDALKILAGKRGRPITRDALAEHLWPDSDGSGNRLSVVLSTLRSVLDPKKAQPSDHYLRADREAVRLDTDHVEVDAVVFTQTATSALRALRSGDHGEHTEPGTVEELERAAAMYTGHYLEDDPYSDFTVDVRDELLSLSLEVKRELALALIAGGDQQRAIPWLVGLIADDPYDEPSHHHLITALHEARRHGEARRAYRSYAVRMKEIGTPAAELEELLTPRA